tara:strand:+ start:140 stop:319 length:180 start_codon:yes stop_codon:yes gene_type:complete
MDYRIIENLLINIYSFGNDYRILLGVVWLVIMFFLLRRLAKKDNEFYLKDFFKKNKKNN